MKFVILSSLCLLSAVQSWGSALVQKDKQAKKLTVYSQMHYYTSHSGWDLLPFAKTATTQISNFWNESKATVVLGQVEYSVEFVLGYDVIRNANDQTIKVSSCAENFIKVDSYPWWPSSYYDKVGAQTGWFLVRDIKKYSSTAPHEFGHGLMLDHDSQDQTKAEGVPGIMFDRTTLVRSKYQWEPTVSSGLTGGTININYRKVRLQDVRRIPFDQIQFNSEGFACLGDGLNKPIEIKNAITVE